MLQEMNQTESRELESRCEAVSPKDAPCDELASYKCGVCGKWYCAIHAASEAWHDCVLESGDEGGEG